jgi:hypothetical protein
MTGAIEDLGLTGKSHETTNREHDDSQSMFPDHPQAVNL